MGTKLIRISTISLFTSRSSTGNPCHPPWSTHHTGAVMSPKGVPSLIKRSIIIEVDVNSAFFQESISENQCSSYGWRCLKIACVKQQIRERNSRWDSTDWMVQGDSSMAVMSKAYHKLQVLTQVCKNLHGNNPYIYMCLNPITQDIPPHLIQPIEQCCWSILLQREMSPRSYNEGSSHDRYSPLYGL